FCSKPVLPAPANGAAGRKISPKDHYRVRVFQGGDCPLPGSTRGKGQGDLQRGRPGIPPHRRSRCDPEAAGTLWDSKALFTGGGRHLPAEEPEGDRAWLCSLV